MFVVAVGTFDGVHDGHRALLARLGEVAAQRGARTAIATFVPRPASVVAGVPEDALASAAYRVALLRDGGADEVHLLAFDAAMAALEPEAFYRDILRARLGAVGIVVGANFRFGRDRRGDLSALAALAAADGVTVATAHLAERDGTPISSSRIRKLVGTGDVLAAGMLLGRPVTLEGIVVRGDARGRELGMPTANLDCDSGLLVPAEGVYAGEALLADGRRRRAAISIGTNPSFPGAREVRVEAFLLDFDGDLYGQSLRLGFRTLVRSQERFTDVDALRARMAADVDETATLPPLGSLAERRFSLPRAG